MRYRVATDGDEDRGWAVLYTRYGWFKRRIMQRIVAKAGGDGDTTRDYEYTNWADLRTFVEAFAGPVSNRSGGSQTLGKTAIA